MQSSPLASHQATAVVSRCYAGWAETRLEDSSLTQYTGSFDFIDFPSLEIYLYQGDLYGQTSQGKSILKQLDQKDSFEIVDYQARVKFNRNSEGNIISLELEAQGFTSTGMKRKSSD